MYDSYNPLEYILDIVYSVIVVVNLVKLKHLGKG